MALRSAVANSRDRDGWGWHLQSCRFATLAVVAALLPAIANAKPSHTAKATAAARIDAAKAAKAWPSFAMVQKAVEKHLATIKDYRKGDLLSQSYVEPIFAELEKLGWKVADRDVILKQVPGDREFMVRELRTNDGRQFMRGIERFPGGYDRVEHLCKLPDADTLMWRLTSGPDGYKMVEYLTTAPGGAVMGEMLSEAPAGKNFNKPTGRLYTEADFLARLKHSYLHAEKEHAKHHGKHAAKTHPQP